MNPDFEHSLKRVIEPKWSKWARLVELYAIAFVGGWLAHMANFPAAWLTGSLLTVAIALFAGRKLVLPNWLRDVGMALIGLILGSGFSPETLHAITSWPLSVAMLCVTVVAITWSAYVVLRRFGGWDHATALFASLPGALGYVMVIAEEAKADMTRVAIAQAIRLFALIAILPMILTPFTGSGDVDGKSAPLAQPAVEATSLDSVSLGLLVIALLVLVPIVLRLKVPAGLLLAGMATSGSLYLSGVYHAPLPDWFTIPGFLTIGAMIGSRFGAISPASLLRLSGISLLSLFASASISGIAAFLCAQLLGFPLGQVFLAFAPGGFEVMVLLAFLFDLNPAYVAGHHLVRYLGLVLLAPLITARLTRSHRKADDD